MRPLPRPSATAAILLAAPGVALAAWGILFAAGGLAPGAATLIAAATTLPAAVLLGLIAGGRWPYARPPLMTLLAAGGLLAFALVAALSSLWSLSPARSRDDAVLAAGYLGALVLGVLLGPLLRRPGTVLAVGVTGLATIASVWALLARSFPSTVGVQFTPRLSGTLTLPNPMAILALAGLFGALGLCAHRDPRVRIAGGAAAGLTMLALVLTSSRSGLGLAVLGVVAMQLVLPAAPRMRLVGIIAAAPAAALGLRIATWPTFTDLTKSVSAAGWGLVAATGAAAALGVLLAWAAPSVLPGAAPEDARRRASRRTLLLAGAALVVVALAVVVRAGGPSGTVDAVRAGFTGPVGQSGVRIGLGANQRDHWWGTAWGGFVDNPLGGTGAGTFRLLEQSTRNPAFTTDSAHHTILEALAGTGLLGGVPFLIGGVALVVMALGGIRQPRPDDDVGATAVAIGALAFLAQGLVDVDWDLAAQGVVVYAAIGAIAPAALVAVRIAPAGRALAGGAAVVLLVAGLVALPSWLGARDTERSSRLLERDPQAALDLAASARRYDPLSVPALLAEAEAREALGDITGAQAALVAAIDREPANYEPWLVYGTFLAFSWDRPAEGRAALNRASRLSGGDPSVLGVLEALPPAEASGS